MSPFISNERFKTRTLYTGNVMLLITIPDVQKFQRGTKQPLSVNLIWV